MGRLLVQAAALMLWILAFLGASLASSALIISLILSCSALTCRARSWISSRLGTPRRCRARVTRFWKTFSSLFRLLTAPFPGFFQPILHILDCIFGFLHRLRLQFLTTLDQGIEQFATFLFGFGESAQTGQPDLSGIFYGIVGHRIVNNFSGHQGNHATSLNLQRVRMG